VNQINQTASVDDDRLDFLDLLAIAAETWKLIVIGTLLVAMATALILFLRPPVYESFSSMALSPRLRSTLNSSNVLDPVIKANNLAANFNGDVEATRDSLRRKIKVEELVKDSSFYRISIQGDTPAQAKALAVSYLTQILLQSKPVGSEAEKIQEKITVTQDAIAELQKLSEHLLLGSSTELIGAIGPGKTQDNWYEGLLSITIEIARRKGDIQGMQHELEGWRIDDVLQQPNLPARPVAQHRLSSLLAGTGAGFVALIFFAYLRDVVRKMDKNSERARKLARIREALGWPRQNKVESA
jgi:uncharacterized protein involved in exopolysaccharide biosynthesis